MVVQHILLAGSSNLGASVWARETIPTDDPTTWEGMMQNLRPGGGIARKRKSKGMVVFIPTHSAM